MTRVLKYGKVILKNRDKITYRIGGVRIIVLTYSDIYLENIFEFHPHYFYITEVFTLVNMPNDYCLRKSDLMYLVHKYI